jgi:hypothetical protein
MDLSRGLGDVYKRQNISRRKIYFLPSVTLLDRSILFAITGAVF